MAEETGVCKNESYAKIEVIDEDSLSVLSKPKDTSTALVLTPSATHLTSQTAKWISILPEDKDQKALKESQGISERKHWFKQPRSIRSYYSKLRKDEEVLKEAELIVGDSVEGEGGAEEGSKKNACCKRPGCLQLSVDTAARLTLSVNVLLFFLKLAASIQSGSLSVISSLIDSTLDLLSGAIIAITSYLMHHYDPFYYPIGRTRLEPVAITITAAIMGTSALQIITTSIEEIVAGTADPQINGFSGTIIGLTIVLKGILFFLCCQVDSASVQALATDHRNDVASNIATLVFGLLGTYVLKVLDPIGALILSFYIIINWVLVGREQLINLVGHRADRRFISKITYIAKEHNKNILKVDTVLAYTFGINYLVEVHIVMSPKMKLEESHDIGESLQLKLESLREVERAFVHCDFEYEHKPQSEHVPPSTE